MAGGTILYCKIQNFQPGSINIMGWCYFRQKHIPSVSFFKEGSFNKIYSGGIKDKKIRSPFIPGSFINMF
jgi:hypothetical protein